MSKELDLLDRAQAGEKLSRADREHLLAHLEFNSLMDRAEMAELLQVAERTIYRMLKRLRTEMAREASIAEVVSRFSASYLKIRAAMLKEIRSLPDGKRMHGLKSLWDLEVDFARTFLPQRLSVEKIFPLNGGLDGDEHEGLKRMLVMADRFRKLPREKVVEQFGEDDELLALLDSQAVADEEEGALDDA